MRKAKVFRNGQLVGVLTQHSNNDYEFRYDDTWFADKDLPPISLTMPKSQKIYKSNCLFPFFFNMLSEGVNRQLQSRHLKIDEHDYFGLLLATAQTDTIGAITVSEITK
ncbi:HipA N-terminal domain-containing protein [Draconibacterium sediminis]|uniref:HipA N-terminal domain-containing protein n=1 Tax=Draconibacterium sediminis TaxID=1544798 RepID=UPI0026F155D6|nr:HipA N-terminal domain-containing protein [Draconibacterium sediminis]